MNISILLFLIWGLRVGEGIGQLIFSTNPRQQLGQQREKAYQQKSQKVGKALTVYRQRAQPVWPSVTVQPPGVKNWGPTFSALTLGHQGHNNLAGAGSFPPPCTFLESLDWRQAPFYLNASSPALSPPPKSLFLNLNIFNFVGQIIPCWRSLVLCTVGCSVVPLVLNH